LGRIFVLKNVYAPTPDVRELYIQKKLQSRAQWLGIHIHEAAEWVLKSVRQGRYPAPQVVVDRTLERANRQIEASLQARYRNNPKAWPGFLEHYYGGKSDEPWPPLTTEMARQVMGLFDNPVFLRLTRVPERIREVEELAQIQIEGIPVWVSLDVLVEDDRGGLVIVDWKTGQDHASSKVAAQLGVYGVYVNQRYLAQQPLRADPTSPIKAMYVNTRHNTFETFEVNEEAIQAAKRTIVGSAKTMMEPLSDVNENIAIKADFPCIPEGSEACRRCVYRRSCGRE
jgi:hypothetical protein